jgi:tRNA (uracil-5-)-methyltransferase
MSGVASVSGDAPAEERSVNDSHAPSEGNATMSEIIAAATSDEGSQESTAKEKDTSDPEKKDTDAEASEPAVSEAETNATTTSARPWDHSNRKVLLQGVMKFQNSKAVTKSLDKWIERFNSSSSSGDLQLKYDKVKKPPKETWMVVTLQSEDMVEPFIRFINETEDITNKRGNKIFAKRANEDDRNDNRKRQRPSEDADREQSPTKRQRVSDDEGLQTRRFVTEEEVKDKIIPLWKLSEKEQVEIKMKEMIKKCAMSVVKELKARFR